VPFDRPAFTPTPEQDPDLLLSAARYAAVKGYTRSQQEAFALQSHQRAVAHQADMASEIVPIAGVRNDAYPRLIDATRAARMPVVAQTDALDPMQGQAFALSALTISGQSDGAALVLLLSPAAVKRFNVEAHAAWVAHASVGGAPQTPLLAAELAAQVALTRSGLAHASSLLSVELHDAFAVQGLSFAEGLGLSPELLNPRGGGLARGHPIGASAAIALVRVLANLQRDGASGAQGLVAVAGAGGLGSAAVVARL
jgi:acetyl-CoA C-acetyltransferase